MDFLQKQLIKTFIPVITGNLDKVGPFIAKYKKDKLIPLLKDDENDVMLHLFEKDEKIWVCLFAVDINKKPIRLIPFVDNTTEIFELTDFIKEILTDVKDKI